MSLHNLLTIHSDVGRPGALVKVGTSGGRLLYLEAATHPVVVVAALEAHHVRQLVETLQGWLGRYDVGDLDDEDNVRPLVAGTIARSLLATQADGYRAELARLVQLAPLRDVASVQNCTDDAV